MTLEELEELVSHAAAATNLQRDLRREEDRTILSARAIAEYRRILGSRCNSEQRARAELHSLLCDARYRETHPTTGAQLWRSGRPLQLRYVIDVGSVVWVGQGRPPENLWPR